MEINQHNLIPERFHPNTIGILGGKGAMGEMLADMLCNQGYRVHVTGVDAAKGIVDKNLHTLNTKLIHDSDVIILATPIDVLMQGIPRLCGKQKITGLRNKLFVDIASTKTGVMSSLESLTGAAVIGSHPMFGPTVPTLKGQNVALCPLWRKHRVYDGRTGKCLQWLKTVWEKEDANVWVMSPAQHDSVTSITQVATLLSVFLQASVASKIDRTLVNKLHTPNSRVLQERANHMFRPDAANHNVYAQLLNSHPHSIAVITEMKRMLIEIESQLSASNGVHHLHHQFSRLSQQLG